MPANVEVKKCLFLLSSLTHSLPSFPSHGKRSIAVGGWGWLLKGKWVLSQGRTSRKGGASHVENWTVKEKLCTSHSTFGSRSAAQSTAKADMTMRLTKVDRINLLISFVVLLGIFHAPVHSMIYNISPLAHVRLPPREHRHHRNFRTFRQQQNESPTTKNQPHTDLMWSTSSNLISCSISHYFTFCQKPSTDDLIIITTYPQHIHTAGIPWVHAAAEFPIHRVGEMCV